MIGRQKCPRLVIVKLKFVTDEKIWCWQIVVVGFKGWSVLFASYLVLLIFLRFCCIFSAVDCRLLGVGFDCRVECRWQLLVTGFALVGCLMVTVDCRLSVVVIGFWSLGCRIFGR